MIEQYICKQNLIERLSERLSEKPDMSASEAISLVQNTTPERVVPQHMYRLAEYDKNKLLNELKYFEATHNVLRCSKCRYGELVRDRFFCKKFRLFDGEKIETPSNGYCAWAEPKEV